MNQEYAAFGVEPAGSDDQGNMFWSVPEPAIDRSVLDKLNAMVPGADDEPFAVRAARIYLKSSAKLVASMETGLMSRDAKAVCFAVHTLKSSSNALGAKAMGQSCAELEMLTHLGSLDNSAAMAEEILREYGRVRSELNEFIADSNP